MAKMTKRQNLEARAQLINQQMIMVSMGGENENTLEYKDLKLELQDVLYQLDHLPITAQDLKEISGQQIIKNRFKVKRFGTDYVQIIGFHYGDEEIKLVATVKDAAKWINEYFGLVEK